jgi:membrane protease subunit HflK
MEDKNNKNNKPTIELGDHDHDIDENANAEDTRFDQDFDAGTKSLSEALRVSFLTLKIIMVILVVVFLASGFRTVGPDEQALVLRFGKIRGLGEDRILKPGPHWLWPNPIDVLIRIPVQKNVDLVVDSFWYRKSKRPPESLDPVRHGYCITRSEKEAVKVGGISGNDYNIVHAKWRLTYKIKNPELFYKNVFVDTTKIISGQNYADVIFKNVNPLLKNVLDDAVVTAMVHYTIDEARVSDYRIREHVRKIMQRKLDTIESGVAVVTVLIEDVIWPVQVNQAFLESIRASQTYQRLITEAKGYAENTLNETAGPYGEQILDMIHGIKKVDSKETEFLWDQLAGAGQEKIAGARAYRTQVVENAQGNAEYLRQILPEYNKRPKLVLQKIYQQAIENVLNNAEEKMVLQSTSNTKGNEIRIMLNRDPKLKSMEQVKNEEKQAQASQNAPN